MSPDELRTNETAPAHNGMGTPDTARDSSLYSTQGPRLEGQSGQSGTHCMYAVFLAARSMLGYILPKRRSLYYERKISFFHQRAKGRVSSIKPQVQQSRTLLARIVV
ncbi:uncharacterized protein BDCG_00943 [Blastomyces dermatitidis ER-3]|uniref:Uncharacterized protein n=2 Tax=Blastomyces TaxID=229219 RepID=A0A179UIU8_BLAGS|nr:uncharacterized protein BDBG_03077 [Blastomyces gilchristii SLH14081]XP_045272180.1 uncharacterized protein BDCG_00943 [Blastomyces dermatitidis ER-3]EEQ84138.2 hypothetical protein BDCG_00943 [Blastomyces dermatitidis ER-3]EQL34437.1 hypothetical protein BDFG_03784 [Blastomyces dermatitidis ATCC 26199]OAT06951.1 hypothetical protein BDBG_03077 [Blastomyces gilchristii SLH14081]